MTGGGIPATATIAELPSATTIVLSQPLTSAMANRSPIRSPWCATPGISATGATVTPGQDLYDYDNYVAGVVAAWRLARANGLNVIFMMNSSAGGGSPPQTTQWADDMTKRAILTLCDHVCSDRGTMWGSMASPTSVTTLPTRTPGRGSATPISLS